MVQRICFYASDESIDSKEKSESHLGSLIFVIIKGRI